MCEISQAPPSVWVVLYGFEQLITCFAMQRSMAALYNTLMAITAFHFEYDSPFLWSVAPMTFCLTSVCFVNDFLERYLMQYFVFQKLPHFLPIVRQHQRVVAFNLNAAPSGFCFGVFACTCNFLSMSFIKPRLVLEVQHNPTTRFRTEERYQYLKTLPPEGTHSKTAYTTLTKILH